jgi:predicted RNase H-like HicB family nuclease
MSRDHAQYEIWALGQTPVPNLGYAMSKYYVLVLVPQQGGWRAHFPDIPNCRAEAERVEFAIQKATAAAGSMMQEFRRKGIPVNEPRSFEEIRSDNSWAAERSIQWPEVIVSLVGLQTDQSEQARLAS